MHMADALLSPVVGAAFWAGTLGVITYCAKKIKENINDSIVPLMGVLGAFIFAAQMINFTIPGTGSSGHLGGGMILAVILGPYAAFLVMASVLTVQSLFFADGGLLALGSNIWNLGIYPCFIAYPFIYRPLVKSGNDHKRISIASIISAVVALQFGAASVVLQTILSGQSALTFSTFLLFMQPIHLCIGIVEGFITAGVIHFVNVARPELLQSSLTSKNLSQGTSIKKVLAGFLIAAVITGGMISMFASSNPDGLEWSIEKIYGKPELPEAEKGIIPVLKNIQEKTAVLPDYNFKQGAESAGNRESGESWANTKAGTSVSGLLGPIMVLGIIVLMGIGIKAVRKLTK